MLCSIGLGIGFHLDYASTEEQTPAGGATVDGKSILRLVHVLASNRVIYVQVFAYVPCSECASSRGLALTFHEHISQWRRRKSPGGNVKQHRIVSNAEYPLDDPLMQQCMTAIQYDEQKRGLAGGRSDKIKSENIEVLETGVDRLVEPAQSKTQIALSFGWLQPSMARARYLHRLLWLRFHGSDDTATPTTLSPASIAAPVSCSSASNSEHTGVTSSTVAPSSSSSATISTSFVGETGADSLLSPEDSTLPEVEFVFEEFIREYVRGI